MEIFSSAFFSALLAIILIDLALAGDNAIVIALAARRVPVHMQKKVLMWGSIAAVAVRAFCTMFVVWLLKVPGFLLAGGLVLIFISFKLVRQETSDDGDASAGDVASDVSMRQAVQTIIIADTAMGIENVIAVGGAAHGSMLLVIIGLVVSVPLIMFGSQIVLKMVERFPIIVTMGGALLAWTAVKMITNEHMLKEYVAAHHNFVLAAYFLAVGGVVLYAYWQNWSRSTKQLAVKFAVMVVWLGVFEQIETWVNMHPLFEPGWHPAEEIVDAFMWLGWIPLVIWMGRFDKPNSSPNPSLAPTA